jgi:hypothetical protein
MQHRYKKKVLDTSTNLYVPDTKNWPVNQRQPWLVTSTEAKAVTKSQTMSRITSPRSPSTNSGSKNRRNLEPTSRFYYQTYFKGAQGILASRAPWSSNPASDLPEDESIGTVGREDDQRLTSSWSRSCSWSRTSTWRCRSLTW